MLIYLAHFLSSRDSQYSYICLATAIVCSMMNFTVRGRNAPSYGSRRSLLRNTRYIVPDSY